MRILFFILFILVSSCSFSQDTEWVKTEGVITEITVHRGRKTRETAIIKFQLENGQEQLGSTELFRLPFVGSMKSVGDKITINYRKDNPVIIETLIGNFLSNYGMYILVILGIIFSIKPILKYKKNSDTNY